MQTAFTQDNRILLHHFLESAKYEGTDIGDCHICQYPAFTATGEVIIQMPTECKQMYHYECLVPWFDEKYEWQDQKDTCPDCRKPLFQIPLEPLKNIRVMPFHRHAWSQLRSMDFVPTYVPFERLNLRDWEQTISLMVKYGIENGAEDLPFPITTPQELEADITYAVVNWYGWSMTWDTWSVLYERLVRPHNPPKTRNGLYKSIKLDSMAPEGEWLVKAVFEGRKYGTAETSKEWNRQSRDFVYLLGKTSLVGGHPQRIALADPPADYKPPDRTELNIWCYEKKGTLLSVYQFGSDGCTKVVIEGHRISFEDHYGCITSVELTLGKKPETKKENTDPIAQTTTDGGFDSDSTDTDSEDESSQSAVNNAAETNADRGNQTQDDEDIRKDFSTSVYDDLNNLNLADGGRDPVGTNRISETGTGATTEQQADANGTTHLHTSETLPETAPDREPVDTDRSNESILEERNLESAEGDGNNGSE